VAKKKRARRARDGKITLIVIAKVTKIYAWGEVVVPLAEGGQGVPGDGVIPGDELVLP